MSSILIGRRGLQEARDACLTEMNQPTWLQTPTFTFFQRLISVVRLTSIGTMIFAWICRMTFVCKSSGTQTGRELMMVVSTMETSQVIWLWTRQAIYSVIRVTVVKNTFGGSTTAVWIQAPQWVVALQWHPYKEILHLHLLQICMDCGTRTGKDQILGACQTVINLTIWQGALLCGCIVLFRIVAHIITTGC